MEYPGGAEVDAIAVPSSGEDEATTASLSVVETILETIALNNYTAEDCDVAWQATTTVVMQSIRFVHVVLCSAGIISCALLIFVLLSRSARHLHVNLRLSLASLTIAALIACAQLFFTAAFTTVLTVASDDKCNIIFDSQSCALLRWPVVLAIYATLAGIICVAVERAIATVKYRTYEAHGCREVGVTLIIVQWTTSLLCSFFSIIMRHDPGFVHYCTVYVSHPKSAIISLCFMTILELVTLLFFITLLSVNKYKQVHEFVNNALHSLTERYQLLENVRIMQTLIPSLTVHASLSLLGLAAMLLFAIVHQEMNSRSVARFAPFSELVLLVVPIYSIVFSAVAVACNPQLRQAARGALPVFFTPRPNPPLPGEPPLIASRPSKQMEKESDRHFNLLADMWNK